MLVQSRSKKKRKLDESCDMKRVTVSCAISCWIVNRIKRGGEGEGGGGERDRERGRI